MVNYRRSQVSGGTYFFTVTLRDRTTSYLTEYAQDLRECFQQCKTKFPFTIDAIVILPEHLHCIWTLPSNDFDYSKRWQIIKSEFTKRLIRKGVPLIQDKQGQYNLWQRRFWEHTIRDETDLKNHIDYIHYNPVKHGLSSQVKDWSFSSFHQFVETKQLPIDWGASMDFDDNGSFGE